MNGATRLLRRLAATTSSNNGDAFTLAPVRRRGRPRRRRRCTRNQPARPRRRRRRRLAGRGVRLPITGPQTRRSTAQVSAAFVRRDESPHGGVDEQFANIRLRPAERLPQQGRETLYQLVQVAVRDAPAQVGGLVKHTVSERQHVEVATLDSVHQEARDVTHGFNRSSASSRRERDRRHPSSRRWNYVQPTETVAPSGVGASGVSQAT